MNASIIQRFSAFMIDYLLIAGYLILLIIFNVFVFPFSQKFFQDSLITAQFMSFLMVTLPIALYFIVSDYRCRGQTFGKRKMKIRVVNKYGGNISLFQSVIRNVIKLFPWELSHFLTYRLAAIGDNPIPIFYIVIGGVIYALMFFYILSAIFSKRKQSIYDFAAKTQVLKVSQ